MKKKIISFDLWDTLIKKNPEFSTKRAELLKEYTHHDIQYIKDVFAVVKKDFDGMVEKYGIQFDNYTVYEAIFTKLDIDNSDYFLWSSLINKIDTLFLEYHPIIYSEDTIKVLDKLSDKYHLVLISNTLLINGEILYEVLTKLDLIRYFVNIEFSSTVKHSKPHTEIFKRAYAPVINGVTKEEIIHVGDNIRTDLYGSTHYGVEGYLINNHKTSIAFKNKTITDFLNHIETNEK